MKKQNINKVVEMLNLDDLKEEILGYFNEQECLLIDNLKEYNKAEFVYFNEALEDILNENIEWFLKENYSIEQFNTVFDKVDFGALSNTIYNQLDLYNNINYYTLIDNSLIYEKWGDYVKSRYIYSKNSVINEIKELYSDLQFKIKKVGIDEYLFKDNYFFSRLEFNYLDNQVIENTYFYNKFVEDFDIEDVEDYDDELYFKIYDFIKTL